MAEYVSGEKLVDNLRKEIESTQEIIDILRAHIENLKKPDYLQGIIKEEDKSSRIDSYESTIELDTKLIAIMKRQLEELICQEK